MHPAAPMHLLDQDVEASWIDYNGHMNVGYYVVAFDRATDEFIDRLGMDEGYRQRTGCSVYVLETHVTYQRELKLGERMSVDLQLLDFDPKRLHYFMRMHRLPDEDLAATTEILLMHVDTRAGRGAGMPAAVLAAVEDLARTQAALPRPEEVGRPIGIRRR